MRNRVIHSLPKDVLWHWNPGLLGSVGSKDRRCGLLMRVTSQWVDGCGRAHRSGGRQGYGWLRDSGEACDATEGCPIATDEHPAEEPDRDGAPSIIPRTLESPFASYVRCNLPHAGFFVAGLHGTEHIEMNYDSGIVSFVCPTPQSRLIPAHRDPPHALITPS